MDKKAYRDRLRSQDKRERTAASLGLPYSGRDLAIAFGLYLAAVLLCLFLRNIDLHRDTSYVAVIFLLDVFLTAYWTNGYILGIITAVAGVFSVDYIFTYPYWHISFTLTGFPLTFLVMMTISVLTAAVTSRAKQTETVRREAEREKMYADLLRAVSHDIRTPLTGIVGATNVLLEQDGELTQEQAKNHPGKNVITRAVGTESSVEGDIYLQKLHRDDCLLLCSDGLSNVMADQEMLFEVAHGVRKSDCCQRLLRIAKNRGAPDNVTVAMALV